MPSISDGLYEQSDSGLTVRTRILPGEDRRAYVCLAGEIDRDSSAVLCKTADWLTTVAPVSVLMDLSGSPSQAQRYPTSSPESARLCPTAANSSCGELGRQRHGCYGLPTWQPLPPSATTQANPCGTNRQNMGEHSVGGRGVAFPGVPNL